MVMGARAKRILLQALSLSAAALAAAVGGCGGEEHRELQAELNQMTKDVRGRVDPLPQVRPYEPVPYTAESQIDPFRPERIDVARAGVAANASKLAPDPNRPKEPLEASQISLKELVQDAGGDWVERSSALQLVEAKR